MEKVNENPGGKDIKFLRSADCEDLFRGALAGSDGAMNCTNVANASGLTSKEEFVLDRPRQDLLRL